MTKAFKSPLSVALKTPLSNIKLLCLCCQDFILEHYSEDGNNYEDEIADLMDLRQVMYI